MTRTDNGEWRHTLLEIETGGALARFWAVLQKVPDGFCPIVFNKDRSWYQTIFDGLSLEDARLAIEKYMMDNGVIEDGDEMIYD